MADDTNIVTLVAQPEFAAVSATRASAKGLEVSARSDSGEINNGQRESHSGGSPTATLRLYKLRNGKSSPTISAKPDGAWAGSQVRIRVDERGEFLGVQ